MKLIDAAKEIVPLLTFPDTKFWIEDSQIRPRENEPGYRITMLCACQDFPKKFRIDSRYEFPAHVNLTKKKAKEYMDAAITELVHCLLREKMKTDLKLDGIPLVDVIR